jgi:tetratricopeptide (TPR) repeat protein
MHPSGGRLRPVVSSIVGLIEGVPMVAKDEFDAAAFGTDAFDTVTAISALESTLSLFSNTLQLASMAFGFVPGMGGIAGVLSGISSGFDSAGKVVDGIDKVRDMSDKVLEIYREHPDPAAHPQVADALITKAFTLIRGGSLAEALSVYDDLADRFAADTDPSVIRSVRVARINATAILNKLQRFGETITRCREIVERYGTDPDAAVVADVLSARLNEMEALAELQRSGEAISRFDVIISICDEFDSGGGGDLEVRMRRDRVSAMGMKSMILLRQGKFDQALEASREIAERFGTDQQSAVGRAVRLTTAVVEVEGYQALGEHEKALQACDEVVDLAGSDPDIGVRRGVALILRMKSQSLWALGRGDEVPSVCDEIDQRFGSDPDLILRQCSTRAGRSDSVAGLTRPTRRWTRSWPATATTPTPCSGRCPSGPAPTRPSSAGPGPAPRIIRQRSNARVRHLWAL